MTQVKKTTVAVIIPYYDTAAARKDLALCLSAILDNTNPPDSLILVWDNAPDPLPEIELTPPHSIDGISQIPLKGNQGPASARNTGAQMVKEVDILVFVDADVVLEPQALEKIQTRFDQSSSLDALFGSYCDQPYHRQSVSRFRNLLHHYMHQTGKRKTSNFWAGLGAIRQKTFMEVGGFDEKLTDACIEDIELGQRLHKIGSHIELDPTIQGQHLKLWTLKSMFLTDLFKRAIPWTQIILGKKHLVNDLNTSTPQRLSLLMAGLFFITGSLALFSSPFIVAFLFIIVFQALLNRGLYKLLRNKGGIWFLLQSFLWHQIHYLAAGLGFAFGIVLHFWKKDSA